MSGWAICENCTQIAVMQQTQMPLHENQFCSDLYENHGGRRRSFPNGIICAGGVNSDDSECIGDLGGPLTLPIFDNGKFPFYQIGVISFGMKCGSKNAPHGFTSIQHFADWILKMIDRKVRGVILQ